MALIQLKQASPKYYRLRLVWSKFVINRAIRRELRRGGDSITVGYENTQMAKMVGEYYRSKDFGIWYGISGTVVIRWEVVL